MLFVEPYFVIFVMASDKVANKVYIQSIFEMVVVINLYFKTICSQ